MHLRCSFFIPQSAIKTVHAAHFASKMRGCSTSQLQHSFGLANVCQMCCAGYSGDTGRAPSNGHRRGGQEEVQGL